MQKANRNSQLTIAPEIIAPLRKGLKTFEETAFQPYRVAEAHTLRVRFEKMGESKSVRVRLTPTALSILNLSLNIVDEQQRARVDAVSTSELRKRIGLQLKTA